LGTGQTIEEMGQQPLRLSSDLAGRSSQAGANVGQTLLTGGLSAARTQQAGQGYSSTANLLQGMANSPRLQTGFENWLSGFSQPSGMTGAQNDQLAASFRYNQQPSSSYFIP